MYYCRCSSCVLQQHNTGLHELFSAYLGHLLFACKRSYSETGLRMQGDAHIDAAWNSTAIRTARIAEYVAGMIPSATVLVVGLLPRGDVTLHPTPDAFKLPSKCVPQFHTSVQSSGPACSALLLCDTGP